MLTPRKKSIKSTSTTKMGRKAVLKRRTKMNVGFFKPNQLRKPKPGERGYDEGLNKLINK